MSRLADHAESAIRPDAVERFLRREGFGDDACVVGLRPLGASTQASLKDFGYGRPLLVVYTTDGEERRCVVRTSSADPFGHDRRADRAANHILDYDTFATIPRHIEALSVGAFTSDGEMVAIPPGELFLVSTYVEGELHAVELDRLAGLDTAPAGALALATALARYLAEVHAEPAPATAYVRDLRDTIGSGEGIFGLCDSYPPEHPVATPLRLAAIEKAAVDWRWRLRPRAEERARRTHGDFHPFNILVRAPDDFTVLDCSRGAAGEPADDLTAFSINYLFFALTRRGRFDGALRQLWTRFWSTYLERSGDRDVLEVVAPFFAWRGLVVASPIWYPDIDDDVRDRLLRFVERLLAGARFVPDEIETLLTEATPT